MAVSFTPKPTSIPIFVSDAIWRRATGSLTDRMVDMRWLEASGRDYVLSPEGKEKLRKWGATVDADPKNRRHYARQCLDWSERRHHLAGNLGAAIAARLFELKWIERWPNGRACA